MHAVQARVGLFEHGPLVSVARAARPGPCWRSPGPRRRPPARSTGRFPRPPAVRPPSRPVSSAGVPGHRVPVRPSGSGHRLGTRPGPRGRPPARTRPGPRGRPWRSRPVRRSPPRLPSVRSPPARRSQVPFAVPRPGRPRRCPGSSDSSTTALTSMGPSSPAGATVVGFVDDRGSGRRPTSCVSSMIGGLVPRPPRRSRR